MGKATVVFSNGSKALAHNLDDQYERWQLRRGGRRKRGRVTVASSKTPPAKVRTQAAA